MVRSSIIHYNYTYTQITDRCHFADCVRETTSNASSVTSGTKLEQQRSEIYNELPNLLYQPAKVC